MGYLSDIEIARAATLLDIRKIAEKIDISEDELELYGKYKAKILPSVYESRKDSKKGKLILVTAINPTPAGEGKSTTSVGLGEGLCKIGKNAIVVLREPSLGPVFGVKGGAAGGGYAQVVPMEDINLHFTGDFHAISSANNLLSAAIDNHITQGNSLDIDIRQIVFKRVVDMNDRALRDIVIGLGGKTNGYPREEGFTITVASEIMAILCLAEGLADLKARLSKIIVAYNSKGDAVSAGQLNVVGAMAALLKDAIKPNLVQTVENTPAIIHGGPFANIAHGCNSVAATKMGLALADYVVTEAGFGADLGAEKFFDIKCRMAGLSPDVAVVVATIRALKMHGGMKKDELKEENVDALIKGFANLKKHVENVGKYKIPCVIAINKFVSDTEKEVATLLKLCKDNGFTAVQSDCWEHGGDGGAELARKVVETIDNTKAEFAPLYDEKLSIAEKVDIIVKEIYGGAGVEFTAKAKKEVERLEALGLDKMPICMAKTQYSLSDNPTLLGAPTGFTVTISEVRVSAGAGFIVCLTGNVMTMPGLPKKPAAEIIDIDDSGAISGLF